jgi:hypothetical protein
VILNPLKAAKHIRSEYVEYRLRYISNSLIINSYFDEPTKLSNLTLVSNSHSIIN